MYQNIGGLYGGSPNGPFYATSTKDYVLNGGSPFYFFNIVDGTNGTLHYSTGGTENRFRSVDVRLVRQINTNKRPSTEGASVILSGSLNVSNGITGSTNFNTIVNKPTLISGSSQLTASYDTRYTLSGSVVSGTTPSGTISGSSQLTSSFDLRYLVTGSVTSSITQLNSFTSSINSKTGSFATTGSNSFNGSQQITGSLVVSQNITGSASASFVSLAVNTTTPTQKIHLKGAVGIEAGATMGNTADQFVFGYAGSNLTNFTHKIQTGHDVTAALNRMDFLIANSSNTWKTPLQLRPDIVYVSGSLIVTGSINGTINATNGIVSGSSQITYASISSIPSGIVSGSSQITPLLPTGVVSGSSQLTSSFDTRYAISASFVSSSNLSSIQTITSASYAALTPVSGTLYIIIG